MKPERETLPRNIRCIVDQYLAEWLCTPYRWLQEIDVQVELAGRITRVLELSGEHMVTARHSHYPGRHRFARLTCEPYVLLSAQESYAHPDIVIWDDCDNAEDTINSGTWPMIWSCEIKYTSGPPDNSDRERLRTMLTEGLTLSACWIRMLLADSVTEDRIAWSQDGDLWICDAKKSIKGASNNRVEATK